MIERTRTSPNWYEHAFGALYARRYGHRDDREAADQIEQLVHWLRPAEASGVLDVCCGGGRHLAPLRALGFDAWGVDLSPDLLTLAAQRSALKGRLVRADVRALPFAPRFDWAVNLFTSFGYFEQDSDHLIQMSQMVSVLRPGGRLVVDLPNPEHLKHNLQDEDVQVVGDLSIVNRRELTETHIVKISDVTTQSGENHRFVERVRLYRPEQIRAVAAQAGLADVSLHCNFKGERFDDSAPRMVLLGTRP